VNQEQPVDTTAAAMRTAKDLAFTSHLHRAILAQRLFHRLRLIGATLDEHAEVALAEARIVPDRRRQVGQARRDEHPRDCGEGADQHHELEPDDRVWDPRRNRLAAEHERPVIGGPDGDPVAERRAEESADQRVAANRALRAADRLLDLVAQNRREDLNVVDPLALDVVDRIDRRIELMEYTQDAARQWAPSAFRLGTGRISFTSAIARTGNCLMNSRNHMKNQPKLPSRMA